MLRFSLVLTAIFFSVSAIAHAQSGPLLKSHGALFFPPIARAARVSGQVIVRFSITAAGNTAEVTAIDGPAMLRRSAEDFVRTFVFDIATLGEDLGRSYKAAVEYEVIDGNFDPRVNNDPKTELIGPLTFRFTVVIGDITLSNCPTGAEEDVPSAVSNDDFVEISRSSCYGTCPAYTVKVQADGAVFWEGYSSVKVIGKRSAQIDPAVARTLLERFRTKDFWHWCGGYSRNITDSASTEIAISLGGKTRKISDYAESSPGELQDLLLEVDSTADSHLWRHGEPASEPISQIASDAWLPKPGVTPLMLAAGQNNIDQMKILLNQGANVAATDSSGWTALMYASFVSSEIPTQLLLKAEADPNQSSPRGDTPLMVSAAFGQWSSDLVKGGANVNAQNSARQTALMYLASRDEVDDIAEALKDGADPTLKDKQGRRALDYLVLANCGKSPFHNPIEDWQTGTSTKCTVFSEDDFRKARKLLRKIPPAKH